MRSPLECIDGRYEHALFATYSINLRFFEEWVLPLLRAAGARNVIILADESQLGIALADRSLRSVGRSYHVVSVRLGPGAFHPKLFLLAGEEGARACVTSANLTVDGQLRNVESAIALDSSVAEHRQPLIETAAFVRAIALALAPAHTAEAIMAALAAIDELPGERPSGAIRVIHNLDEPLLTHFPTRELTAVTPYADAGEAAAALSRNGPLAVLTDGATFAAPGSFFSGSWTVFARDFGKRRLHGKAFWTAAGTDSWLLLGSPNLSRPALLQNAAEGNTELAVIVSPNEPPLSEPPGAPWERDELAETAPRRHALATNAETAAAEGGSFNAWEDERTIVVAGLPPDATLEYWQGGAWHALGELVGDRIAPPEDVRPYLLRCISAHGQIKQAIVHRTDQLRIHRLRPRTTSRAADVVSTLPLDLAGVQALESVLRDLYLLGSITDDEHDPELNQRLRERGTMPEAGLSEWVPARTEDEPRIPDIYRRTWKNAPDALLALIRGALRLDTTLAPEEEWDVFEESLDFDAADDEAEQDRDEPGPTEPETPRVEANVLNRYRSSLVRLLKRATEFIQNVVDPALADLAFQSVLALNERIERTPVDVAGELQTLVPTDELLRQKLSLLDAYLLRRRGHDPLCLATARAHLAKCLAAKAIWTPLEWEQLENLAYRTSAAILAANAYAAAAARDAGEALAEITERLRPYADRSAWDGYLIKADELLDGADIRTEPIIWVEGEEWLDTLERSPAWRLIGYGAIVGFAERQPYAVLVRNTTRRSKYLAHLLVCDPTTRQLHELFQRSVDQRWLRRVYAPVDEGTVDDAGRFGPEAILQASASRTPFTEVGDGNGVVKTLLEGIEGPRSAIP